MALAYKIFPALFASALLLSPAAAVPAGPNTMGAISDSLVIQVRSGGHGHGGKGHGGGHRGGKAHHGNKGHHGNRGHGHHGGRNHGHNHGGWNHGGHWHGRGGWVAGRTYYVAPPGWRQYGARPGNWQTLGCVVVNGFWFCP